MKELQILLAEDNPGDVMLVKQALQEHHLVYRLYVVTDGDAALAFMAQMGEVGGPPCPDVMLLDLNLPKVDGVEVLTALRQHPACAQTPVVVISSSDNRRDVARIEALGVAHYFRKPSDLDEFLRLGAVVRELTEKG